MAFVLGVLKWTPAALWAATPLEVAAAARGALGRRQPTGSAPCSDDLAALLAAFPDEDTR